MVQGSKEINWEF